MPERQQSSTVCFSHVRQTVKRFAQFAANFTSAANRTRLRMNRLRANHLRPYTATCSWSSINPWQLVSPGLPPLSHIRQRISVAFLLTILYLLRPWEMFCSSPPPMLAGSTHLFDLIGTYLPPLMATFPDQDGFISGCSPYIDAIPHVHLFIARSSFFNLSYTAS